MRRARSSASDRRTGVIWSLFWVMILIQICTADRFAQASSGIGFLWLAR
ncbi:hypothetical protein Salmuc_03459 [Salipiger mucosus DSM 16094]|uniref:Uncharacterized protein n=1 Tax=Salipiger mucosus DSM 16094 TaxID=1123237 RepID=S9QEY7_9RHOB|nr:hypothetical protein Salmuc_03459 [Salipiger mucosus DSM 16094]